MPAFSSLGPITAILSLVFLLFILLQIIALYSDSIEISLIEDIAAGRSFSWEEGAASDSRQATIGMFQTIALFIAWIVFLFWVYRAQRNVKSFGNQGLSFSPGWAVAWFFIPIANIVQSFRILKEIWKGSYPQARSPADWKHSRPSLLLVPAWWALWLHSALLAFLANFMAGVSWVEPSLYLHAAEMRLIADLFYIPPAIVTAVLVLAIAARQNSRHGQRLPVASSPISQPG